MPGPVMRMAPKPSRVTGRLPPRANTPLSTAGKLSAMPTTSRAGRGGHAAAPRDVPHADSRGAAGGRERRAAHGKIAAMRHENLLGIPATYLPENAEASTALQA